MVPILILAAGRSRRMRGRDKLLEDVGGLPLLRRQIEMAQGTGQPVFVAVPPDLVARRAIIDENKATALMIADADEGLSASLRSGVAQLPDAPAFMIMLGDLVALETADLVAVLGARDAAPDAIIWRGTTADGKPGHPILFDASLRPDFAGLAGDKGADTLVQKHDNATHLVALADNRARFDLDTPEDWDAWRRTQVRT
ncbi:4-diphosphocytidyl-2C-methyl-D-erythritol synthase [Loktanella sp. 5RATIMAR09]|nr:nucleotidyltransferase family protein [Loktanella sp. 5RATIMAR09]KQI72855.1 4-diphosphocytidyl-2C-methyl-D-erythritol synthase [Loktanella sp. 5RATIMAR09]